VDDGSTDHTAEFVERRFPGVWLVCLHGDSGFCRAANVGVEPARAD